MAFFECNLPRATEIPSIYQPEMMHKLCETVEIVHERTNKLNGALALAQKSCSNFSGESFQRVAKQVFDISNERFDTMSESELSTISVALWDGVVDEPRVEWPNATVLYDTWFVTTKDWESLRHFGIGGSESSILQGCNHYQTPEGLWYDKLGYPDKMVDTSKQAIFDRGHFMEDAVIDTFCRITGSKRLRETRMFASKRYPHSTANIDAIIRLVDGNLAIFEAKSAIADKKGDWFGEKIPPNYVTQMRQYAGVLNDDRIAGVYIGMIPVRDVTVDGTYLGSAYNGEYFHHYVERDKEAEEEVLSAEEEFWQNHIVANVKPDPSLDPELDAEVMKKYRETPLTGDSEKKTLASTYAEHEELLDNLRMAEDNAREAKAALEVAEKKRDILRNQVCDMMGENQIAVFADADGKPEFTVKNTIIRKDGVDMKKLKAFFPAAYAECRKESVFTRFSCK